MVKKIESQKEKFLAAAKKTDCNANQELFDTTLRKIAKSDRVEPRKLKHKEK